MKNTWIKPTVYVIVGAVLGLLYYFWKGYEHVSGITSTPFGAALLGAFIGIMFVSTFENDARIKEDDEPKECGG